ncbi:MAG: hypothetical protein LBL28_00245, partial [Treponema sp.]|nr:hypothetical protein [Treponema sp.]
ATEESAPAASPASAYLDLINSGDSAASVSAEGDKAPKAIAAPKRGRAKAGVVDAKPKRGRGRGRKAGGRGGDVALKEV